MSFFLRSLRLACVAAAGLLPAGPVSADTASGRDIRAFFIGHSLMSDIPGMTRALAESDGRTRFNFRHQDIPGAPLRWQWDAQSRRDEFEPQFGGRYHRHLPGGDYNVVVLTDSVPRGGPELEAETVDYLGRFVDFARRQRPEVRVYYYETWHQLTTGTPANDPNDARSPHRKLLWRARIDADAAMWERIVRRVNAAHPGATPVRIIPAGRVLGAVCDAIEAGKIPGWTKKEDLFADAIHTNLYGKYVVALVHTAVLTGRSPLTMPVDMKDVWGGPVWDRRHWDGRTYPKPRPETVKALREVVARALAAIPPPAGT